MSLNLGSGNPLGNESPRTDSTPSRSNDNAQLQWLIESVSQLKTSHERMTNSIEHKFESIDSHLKSSHEHMKGVIDNKFECIETKIEARNGSFDDRFDTRHKATDEKMTSNHNLIMVKMEALELRIHNSIAESKISGAKWYIPLALSIIMGIPGVIWMVLQIVKAVATK